jgi:broad specificity phosphatase PhoE
MKRTLLCLTLFFLSVHVVWAEEHAVTDLSAFAEAYFAAWTETQKPTATEVELEAYLALLKDDVGHQHFPYDPNDERLPDGKARMREGMTHYLGAHTHYSAELNKVVTGHGVVVLQYASHAQGVRPGSGETVSINTEMMEILELEEGRVSMIRKYSE